MSFGTSAGDFVLILQLAWNTFQGAKQACGEYDELTREVANLHKVLERVQEEVARSTTSGENAERRTELDEAVVGCEHILRVMDQVLRKYNALGEDKKKGKRLWQKIKFGNGEMKDLSEIRLKLSTHTTAIMMNLKLYTLGSLGRIEDKLNNQGGDLEGIRESINWIAANMTASSSAKAQGSVWTTYENDDKVFWRELRRQLHREGFSKAALERKKSLLTGYVEELGHRGVFDEDEGSGNNVENAKTAAKNLASHDKHLGVIIEVGEGIEEYRSATDNQDPDITDEGSETESLSSTASSYEYLEPVGASMTSKKSEIEELRPPCPRPVGIADNTVADSTAARSTVYNEANSLRMSTDKKHRSDSSTVLPATMEKDPVCYSAPQIDKVSQSITKEQKSDPSHSSNSSESSSPNMPPGEFVVSVKSLSGREYQFRINSKTTGLQLKGLIQDQIGRPPEYQYLIGTHNNRRIPEAAILAEVGISQGSVIQILLPIWGTQDQDDRWGRVGLGYTPEEVEGRGCRYRNRRKYHA